MTVEEELKLAVDAGFVLPDLTDPERGIVAVRPQPDLRLRATYHDTDDLMLAREGITLRHRTGDGPDRWTLKLPVAAAAPGVREEHDVEGPDGVVPAELDDLLTAWRRGRPLRPVAVLATERRVLLLEGAAGETLAEVVDDEVSVLDGDRVTERFREVEVERREAEPGVLSGVALVLAAAGAVAGEFVPKVVRALGPRATTPGDLPQPPPVTADLPAADAVVAALRSSAARLVGNDVGVRRQAPDAVHQMRVACRRLRSDLRTFSPLLAGRWARPLRDELSWLADELGAARDLEVLRARIRRTAVADPLAPVEPADVDRVDRLLAAREEDALRRAVAALRTQRYLTLLEALLGAAREPRTDDSAEQPSRAALPPLVDAAWGDLARSADRLTATDPDDAWHRARILAKRARYAAEAVEPALGAPARSRARAAKEVQEVLGEHQDAAIAATTVLALAGTARGRDVRLLAVTCGRLAERERGLVRASRAAFPAVWAAVRPVGADGTAAWGTD